MNFDSVIFHFLLSFLSFSARKIKEAAQSQAGNGQISARHNYGKCFT